MLTNILIVLVALFLPTGYCQSQCNAVYNNTLFPVSDKNKLLESLLNYSKGKKDMTIQLSNKDLVVTKFNGSNTNLDITLLMEKLQL
jgi:hypothetical protein